MNLPCGATALLLAALLAACGEPGAASGVSVLPPYAGELPPEARFLAEVDKSRGVRGMFVVIRDPELVPAAAAVGMTPDEVVLGVDLGAVQVAYPVRLLNHHEIVEHRVEGLDLLVCW